MFFVKVGLFWCFLRKNIVFYTKFATIVTVLKKIFLQSKSS